MEVLEEIVFYSNVRFPHLIAKNDKMFLRRICENGKFAIELEPFWGKKYLVKNYRDDDLKSEFSKYSHAIRMKPVKDVFYMFEDDLVAIVWK